MIRDAKVYLLFKLQIECNNRRELIEYCNSDVVNTFQYKLIVFRIKWFEFLYKIVDVL
jgi:hypothetical protein